MKYALPHDSFKQKKKRQEVLAEIEAMASKKMNELTGNTEDIFGEKIGYQQAGKIRTK